MLRQTPRSPHPTPVKLTTMELSGKTFGDYLEIVQDDDAQIRYHDGVLARTMFDLHNSNASERMWAMVINGALLALTKETRERTYRVHALLGITPDFDLCNVSVIGGVQLQACEFQLEFRRFCGEGQMPPPDAVPALHSHSSSSVPTRSLQTPTSPDIIYSAVDSRRSSQIPSPLPSRLTSPPPVSSLSSARSGIRVPDLAVTATVTVDKPTAGGNGRVKRVTTTTVACTGEIKPSDSPEMRRLGFAQGLAYLLNANEICGTWLGLVLIRTRFTRMIHLGDHTIAIEAPGVSEPTSIDVADLLNDPNLGRYLVHELYGGDVEGDAINRDGVDVFYGVFRTALGILMRIPMDCEISFNCVATHSAIADEIKQRSVEQRAVIAAVGTAQDRRAVCVPKLAQGTKRKASTVLGRDRPKTPSTAGDQADPSDQAAPDPPSGRDTEGGRKDTSEDSAGDQHQSGGGQDNQLANFVHDWASRIPRMIAADSCAQPSDVDVAADPGHMLHADKTNDDTFDDISDISDDVSDVCGMSPGDLTDLLSRLCKVVLISTEQMTALQADMASPLSAPLQPSQLKVDVDLATGTKRPHRYISCPLPTPTLACPTMVM